MIEFGSIPPIEKLKSLKSKPIFESNCAIKTLIAYHTNEALSEDILKSDLQLIRRTIPFKQLSDNEIGGIGERACYKFLNELYKNDNPIYPEVCYKVTHLNSLRESFKPYDIEIGERLFIDVKTTRQYENSLFYISVPEASFISENYDNYLFGRVFPLTSNEKYYGIKVASNWGITFCKLKSWVKNEFKTAVDEIVTIDQGDGFKIKTDWLVNICLKTDEDIYGLFPETRELPSYNTIIDYFRDSGLTKDWNSSKYFRNNSFQNYRVFKLITLLSSIIRQKDKKADESILEQNESLQALKLWSSDKLKSFIIACKYSEASLIKCFIVQLLLLTSEKNIDNAIIEAKALYLAYKLINRYPNSNYIVKHIPEINNIIENNVDDIDRECINPYNYENKQIKTVSTLLLEYYSDLSNEKENIDVVLSEINNPSLFYPLHNKLNAESDLEAFKSHGLKP